MRILTLENECFNLDDLPETIEDDVRFSVLDNSDPKDPDFFFVPLIFLESLVRRQWFRYRRHEVTMPVDWSIAVGVVKAGNDLEVLPLTSINDRGFEAFLFNPLIVLKQTLQKLRLVNFYTDVKWYFPKMKNGQLLSVPITEGKNPLCAYFVKDISQTM